MKCFQPLAVASLLSPMKRNPIVAGNPNSSDFIQRRRSILFPCPIDSRSELRLTEKGRADAGESRIFERSATMNKRVRSFLIGVGLVASLSPGTALGSKDLQRHGLS